MLKWIVPLLLVMACGGSSAVPDGLLSEKEMESLMLEIHIAEAIVTSDFQQGIAPKLRQQNLIDSLLVEKNIERKKEIISKF